MKKLFLLLLLSLPALAQLQGPPQPQTGSLTAANTGCIAASCLLVTVPADASTATVILSGTWSATAQFEVCADTQTNCTGTVGTWFSINGQPLPTGQQVTSALANGIWQFDIAGFTNFRVRVSAYSSGTVSASVLLGFGVTGIQSQPVDPCASAAVDKSSFSVAISTATTTVVQAGSTGKRVYVCAFTIIWSSGTTPTIQFEVGTGGTCGTPTVKTGAMALPVTSGQGLIAGAGHTLFSGTAGQDMCIVSTGTTPTVNGWVTFVLM
jgi:hypothetical protein